MTLQYARNCIVLTKKKMTLRFWSSLEIFFVLDSRVVVQFLCFFNGKKLLVFIEHLLYSSIWQVPWTARRSNQSILKEINPEYTLEGLILKLKLQYFGHLMQSANSLEKTVLAGKIEGRRRRGWQSMREDETVWWHHWLNRHAFEQALEDGEEHRSLACCSPWGHKELDTTEQLNSNLT